MNVVSKEQRQAEIEAREAYRREVERKQEERRQSMAAARNLFEDKSFIEDAQTPKYLPIPELGGYVLYCPLSYGERIEVLKIKDQDKQNRRALYLMLKKANPDITEDIINGMRADYVDAVLMAIGKEANRFLLPAIKRALKGFDEALTPKN